MSTEKSLSNAMTKLVIVQKKNRVAVTNGDKKDFFFFLTLTKIEILSLCSVY